MEGLLSKIEAVFREVFDDPKLDITSGTTAANVPGWDSFANINLIFALEHEFKIKFALGEIQELKNVGEMEHVIASKMAAQNANR